jgi:hypothetical protein
MRYLTYVRHRILTAFVLAVLFGAYCLSGAQAGPFPVENFKLAFAEQGIVLIESQRIPVDEALLLKRAEFLDDALKRLETDYLDGLLKDIRETPADTDGGVRNGPSLSETETAQREMRSRHETVERILRNDFWDGYVVQYEDENRYKGRGFGVVALESDENVYLVQTYIPMINFAQIGDADGAEALFLGTQKALEIITGEPINNDFALPYDGDDGQLFKPYDITYDAKGAGYWDVGKTDGRVYAQINFIFGVSMFVRSELDCEPFWAGDFLDRFLCATPTTLH